MSNAEARPTPPMGHRLVETRTFAYLPLSLLVLDPDRQRPLSERLVNKIRRRYHYECLTGAIVAPRSDGTYGVTESQHAVEATRRVADDEGIDHADVLFPCFVLASKDVGLVPELTISRDLIHKEPEAMERWDKNLRIGEPAYVMAEAVLAKYGLRLGHAQNATTIRAVGAVEVIVTRAGMQPIAAVEQFERVIFVLTTAWAAGDPKSGPHRLEGALISSMHQLIRRNPHIELGRLADKLGVFVSGVLAKTKTTKKSRSQVIAEEVIEEYNKHIGDAKKLSW